MREAEWQQQVIELATLSGWIVYHTHDSRHSAAGFPDLVLARPGELLMRELKTDIGKVRPEQQAWLDALQAAGADVDVWRPRDTAAVIERLRRRRNAPTRPILNTEKEMARG